MDGRQLEALRDSPFRRLLGAEWVSMMGDRALTPVIPFAVAGLNGSALAVGIVFAAEFVTLTLLLLLGGDLADRMPRRSVMIGADLARCAVMVAVGVLYVTGGAAIWQLVAAQAVLGAGTAFFQPALTGLIPEMVSEGTLQEANGLRGIGLATATMAGPALGGGLLALVGAGWAFVGDGLTFLVSAALLTGLARGSETSRPKAPEDAEPVLSRLAEGWATFRSLTWLWSVVAGFAILNAAVFAPYYVLGADVVNGGSSAWAAILVCQGIGAVLGAAIVVVWTPIRRLWTGILAVGAWVPLSVLLAAGAPLPATALCAVLAGGGLAVFDGFWATTFQSKAPPDQISRLSSYDWLGGMAPVGIGFLLAPVAAATVGATAGILMGGVVVAAVTVRLATLPSIRRLRVEPSAVGGEGAEVGAQVGAEAAS